MINTVLATNHTLWDQIVKKEQEAKKRFEYLTGESVERKFYSQQNEDNVKKSLNVDKNAAVLTQNFASSKMPNISRSV